MKSIWFVVFCLLCFFNCENSQSKSSNPLSLVPDDTEIIIRINSAEGLESGMNNNNLIKATKNFALVEDFNRLLIPLYLINKNNSLITLSKGINDSLEVCFIVPFSKESLSLDSIASIAIDSAFQNKNGIKKLNYNGVRFYSKIIDSSFFVSNTFSLAENASAKKTIAPEIEQLFAISDKEKMVSVYMNHNNRTVNPVIFKDSVLNQQQFSNYTMIDSDISQNGVFINGITKAEDSTNSLINVFKNTVPQENKIASIIPNTIESFKSITFDSYEMIQQNLIKHQFQDSITEHSDIFRNIVEVGQVTQTSQQAVILRSIDPSSTLDNLNTMVSSKMFRDVNIYAIDDAETFLNDFSPLIKMTSANHFINIDDFFIFSNNIPFLESIISNYLNNTVLSESEAYIDSQLDLSDEASLLLFGNSTELNTLLNLNFTDDKKLDLSNFKTSLLQYVYDTDFAHINAVFKTFKTKRSHNSVAEEFNISIDADLVSAPQLVKNHTTNQMDIAVQDINNNLYLISNKGKVFWKKQLDGKILGSIEQIDTYKNGRLQLVFNTSKHLYVLDRNGNNVNAFPLKFNDAITQPVSVFDYENKKNYRLLVTQGKSVLMYDKNGKNVTGFTYKTAPNNITSQPQHFRINRKDFIVFASGNKLEILDRVGRTRIKVKEDISFSDNGISLYNNNFTTSNTNGELLEVNQSGNVNHKNLNANINHKIATTSRTLVVMNDNKLTIKSKTIELDFGDYTAPKIFYINDKIYVTVTDLQSKKGYLFDSQAQPISNFPVYANSELELNNIDKDSALEIVTKGDANTIIVYEFQ